MRPDLVIFDCDGVLVDSELVSNEVLSRNLSRHGLDLTARDCLELFIGGTMVRVGEKADEMGARLPPDWIDEIYAEIYARLRQGVPAVDGVEAVLDRLDILRIPYCVASNGSEEKMGITLGQTGLLTRFDGAVFSAHTLKVAKPDPGLFLKAAQAFRAAPDNCIVVEDSLSGARAARDAGMLCYGYAPDGDGAVLKNEGAIVFRNMNDLLSLPGLAC